MNEPRRPCVRCGHPAIEHRPEPIGPFPTRADGAIVVECRLGQCRWTEGALSCACSFYQPDELSRVSELLGRDVRMVVGV